MDLLKYIKSESVELKRSQNAVTKKESFRRTTLNVVPPGIEPGTQGFSVLCSTN